MDEEMQAFYISGVYFKECADVRKFLGYAKHIRNSAGEKVNIGDINYALFEVLAESGQPQPLCQFARFQPKPHVLNAPGEPNTETADRHRGKCRENSILCLLSDIVVPQIFECLFQTQGWNSLLCSLM